MYQNCKNDFKIMSKTVIFHTVCKQNFVYEITPVPELHHSFLETKFDH